MPIQINSVRRNNNVAASKEATKVIPLRNDRTLEEYEILAEQRAVELSIKAFRRILPVPGTLGYLFRDIQGGNRAVYEFVKSILPLNNSKGRVAEYNAKKVILIWNAMDEHSQNRVDVFDWLCDKIPMRRDDFYSLASKGMFNHHAAINQRQLMEAKTEVINTSRQLALNERNFKDRELMANATGLTKAAPLIGNIDVSTNVNMLYQSNFSSSIKSTEGDIKELMDVKDAYIEADIVEDDNNVRQLTEGNTEFLNIENQIENEEELLAVLRR